MADGISLPHYRGSRGFFIRRSLEASEYVTVYEASLNVNTALPPL